MLLINATKLVKIGQPLPKNLLKFDTEFDTFSLKGLQIVKKLDEIGQFLTPKQVRAARLLASGESRKVVAEDVNVSRQTINNWLNHNTYFQSTVESMRSEIEQQRDQLAARRRLNLTNHDVSKENSSHTLTPQQQKAAEMIATGKTLTEVAEEVGVARPTLSHWFNHNAEFQREVEARIAELWQVGTAKLRGLIPRAVEVLAGALDGKDAVKAAIQILRIAGMDNSPMPVTPGELTDLDASREGRKLADMLISNLHLSKELNQQSDVIPITEEKYAKGQD